MHRLIPLFCMVLFQIIGFSTAVRGQDIVINEIVSNNLSGLQDEDGDFSDWIELYNNGDDPVDLSGYFISDNASNPYKWMFPEIEIPPQSFLLLFASGKDRLDIEELHTNFKIEAEGEDLLISNSEGILVDHMSEVELADNEAFGRLPDGNDNSIELFTATPGLTNNINGQLLFSHPAGFYNSDFQLSINSTSGDSIYYTFDAEIPSINSQLYFQPLHIENINSQENFFSEFPTTPTQDLIGRKAWESPGYLLDKARIIRCASFRNGERNSRVYTLSYFIEEGIHKKYDMPVISLVSESDNLFHPDSGIYVPGINYNSNNPEWTGNYFKKGDSWERSVHIEYFEPNGSLEFSQDAGVRIHGGKTRQAAQKSLRLYAKNEYGQKYFNYPLFPKNTNEKYKRFILRTTMGSWFDDSMLKDAFAHDAVRNLNVDFQDFQPVVVFLNGEYWGIHDMRERIDEKYIAYNHNVDEDSVIFSSSDNLVYNQLLDYIRDNDLAIDENYEYVKTQIAIDNFIDYYIAEMFFANYDWPANNNASWRHVDSSGKWRHILYDLDGALTHYEDNMFRHTTLVDSSVTYPNPPSSTFLFRNFIKNEIFVERFVNRYEEVLNNNFNSDTLIHKLSALKQMYDREAPHHIHRWHYPESYNKWENSVDSALTSFIENRPCVVKENIINFFDLDMFNLNCQEPDPAHPGELGLIIGPNPNDGNFYLWNQTSEANIISVILFTTTGRVIYEKKQISLESREQVHFSFPHLASGSYILRILDQNNIANKKIIVY